jgi:hypothetical protein
MRQCVGLASGALELGVGGGHIDFYAVAEGEVGGDAVFVKASHGCCLHIGVMRGGETCTI